MPGDLIASNIGVRSYEPRDEPRILELYEACFGRQRTVEEWRWRHVDVPHHVQHRVLTIDGRVMGFVARRWSDAWVDGRRARLMSGGDHMIDPEVQGRGLAKVLNSSVDLDDPDVTLGFPRWKHLSAYHDAEASVSAYGDLPQWVRWQTGEAVHADAAWIPRFAGGIATAALRLRSAAGTRTRDRRAVVDVDRASFDDWAGAIDDLATASRHFAAVVVVRDARHLHWRWLKQPERAWRLAVVPSDATPGIDGFVVYGTRAGQGRIVDLLASDATAMESLVRSAVGQLSRDGVERILFELADPRPWSARVLRRCGFLPRGRVTEMRISAYRAPWMSEDVLDPGLWYITLGDTDHD